MIDYVLDFHKKFSLPTGDIDKLSHDINVQKYRIRFLHEELAEFEEALANGDKVKAFDALLDMVYVAYGTALFAGINPDRWKKGMEVVHKCNMSKIRVDKAENSKRKSNFDVIKPEGWVGPEEKLSKIIKGL